MVDFLLYFFLYFNVFLLLVLLFFSFVFFRAALLELVNDWQSISNSIEFHSGNVSRDLCILYAHTTHKQTHIQIPQGNNKNARNIHAASMWLYAADVSGE